MNERSYPGRAVIPSIDEHGFTGGKHIVPLSNFGHRLNNRVILLLLYFLAFWPLLVNNGIYWDDWAWHNQSAQTLANAGAELGAWFGGYPGLLLTSVSPVFAKWFIFVVYLLAMLVLYQVFVRTRLFSKESSLLLTLFATLIPYNSARITLACFNYAVCYLLFLCAFWILLTYLEKRRLFLRLACLVGFFLSFTTNSLLVYYLIVLIYIAYRERASLGSVKGVFKKCLAYLDFILIPVVFYAMRALLFVPSGVYGDYNQISILQIIESPYDYLLSLNASFANVIGESLVAAASSFGVSALLIIGINWVLARKDFRGTPSVHAHYSPARRFLLGAFLFYIGLLPYIAVGRSGADFGAEWRSRDQLLLGIGAAFMLYFGLKYLFARFAIGAKPQQLVFAIVLSSFIVANMGTYMQFQVDWWKQLSFIDQVKDSRIIKDNTTFVVEDRATALNAMNRRIRFYEYTGMLKQAFGDETRLAAVRQDFDEWLTNRDLVAPIVRRPEYNLSDYKFSPPTHLIEIDSGTSAPGTSPVGLRPFVELLIKEFVNPEAFRRDETFQGLISVRVKPLDAANTVDPVGAPRRLAE